MSKRALVGELVKVQHEVIELQGRLNAALKDQEPYQWKTQDGRLLLPRNMDESHLRNTVSFLQRRLVAVFGTTIYLKVTKELAIGFVEMLRECERRGLDV